MSIGAELMALGGHGYSVRVYSPNAGQATVQILFGGDDKPVVEYTISSRVDEYTVDIALEAILGKACKDLSLH